MLIKRKNMKVNETPIKKVYDEIVKEIAKIPQIDLQNEPYEDEIKLDNHHYFMNIQQQGTTKLWFALGDFSGKTTLSFVIAIQSPPDWNIDSHHFIPLENVIDMVELTKRFLRLEGRI